MARLRKSGQGRRHGTGDPRGTAEREGLNDGPGSNGDDADPRLARLQADNAQLQREISQRRQIEEALRESQTRYAMATAAGAVSVWDHDLKSAEVHIDPVLPALLGFGPGQLDTYDGWINRIHPDDLDRVRAHERSILAPSAPVNEEGNTPFPGLEFRLLHRDGSARWVLVRGTVLRDAAGAPYRIVGTTTDITERKNAEAALRRSEERYRGVVEGQTELICRFLPDGTVTFVNSAYCRAFRKSPEQLVGRSFWPLLPEEDRERGRRHLASITPDRPVATMEHPVLAPGGDVRWQQWTDRGFFDEQGRLLEFQSVGRDITERKKAEEAAAAAYEEVNRLKDQLQADNVYLQEQVKLKYNHGDIVGNSAAIRRVLHQVEQVAGTGATVLILGETGTGKELLARAIHGNSPRRDRPMVMLNCAALPATLVESELFGREKGAYTGALTRQSGRFEQADGSTLFLDEVGELPLEVQAKLLRVLQEGRFERLGSTRTHHADVRIVAASNRDLDRAVSEGKFREDLYYRLNVFPIRLPPLRERREDIPGLVWAFVKEFGRAMGKTIDSIPRAHMDALQHYAWPGNVRELRNVIERAMIVARGPTLNVELPAAAGMSPGAEAPLTLEEVERRHILAMLEQTGWRVSGKHGAAQVLGLKPTTLESRMARLGIHRKG